MHAVEMLKRSLKKTALTQTVEDYAGRSSIHGIGYVFDRDLNLVDRLLWLFVVLGLLLTAGIFTGNFWSQWKDEQVNIFYHLQFIQKEKLSRIAVGQWVVALCGSDKLLIIVSLNIGNACH